jgi:hypothetical protein
LELVPEDFQSRAVRVSISRYRAFTERLALCAAIPALALAVGLLVYVVANWGMWKDYRDPVLVAFVAPFAAGCALFGILWLVTRPLVAAKTDESKLKADQADLRQTLTDLLSTSHAEQSQQKSA